MGEYEALGEYSAARRILSVSSATSFKVQDRQASYVVRSLTLLPPFTQNYRTQCSYARS